MQTKHIYKVVVIGQSRVGKSSIAVRFVQDTFDLERSSTIDATYLEKTLDLQRGVQVKLTIWDTAGQQRYHAIVPVYYRDSNGAIIVYEVTYRQSFQKAQLWVKQLREFAPKDIVIYLVANKIDLSNNRQVQKQQAEKYCHENGITHFEVSAKTGYNINEMFVKLAKQIYHSESQAETKTKKRKNSRRIDLVHSEHMYEKHHSRYCC